MSVYFLIEKPYNRWMCFQGQCHIRNEIVSIWPQISLHDPNEGNMTLVYTNLLSSIVKQALFCFM